MRPLPLLRLPVPVCGASLAPMNTLLLLLASVALSAAADQPKIEYQRGPCLGGNKPSARCKTCKDCAYCGPKRHPGGVCAVCEKAKAEKAEK